jgi:hypothetical protein
LLKTFIRGLVFGAGLSTALVVFGIALAVYLKSMNGSDAPKVVHDYSDWNSLSDEEKIQEASAIAVIRYSDGEEGQRLAIVEAIHKRTPDVEIYYESGDSWPSADYYPRHQHDDRTGAVVLFRGSTAKDLSTWYMYDERIAALGDMPLELLVKKFNEGV